MPERLEIFRRLLADSIIYKEAATFCSDGNIAFELERLAEHCRDIAVVIIDEVWRVQKH